MRTRIALRLTVATVFVLVITSTVAAFAVSRGIAVDRAEPAVVTSDPSWSAHVLEEGLQEGGEKCIFFLDASEGWIGTEKGLIYHTTDGGLTWNKTFLPNQSLWVEHIQFVNKSCGWALATGWYTDSKGGYNDFRLYRTTDGGATWKKQWIRKEPVEAFQFIDENRGWFVATTNVYTTANGGAKLTDQHARKKIPSLGSAHLQDLHFVDAKNGWVCGGYMGGKTTPIMLRTSNGGSTWKVAKSGLAMGIDDVSFAKSESGTVGYALGSKSTGAAVYKTTNAGTSWSRIKYTTTEHYDSVQAFGASDVRMIGNDKVSTSRDAGKAWASVEPKVDGQDTLLGDMSFVSIDAGWVLGELDLEAEGERYYVLRTPAAEDAPGPSARIPR